MYNISCRASRSHCIIIKVNKSSSKPTLIPNKNYFAAFARTVNGLRAKYSSMT